jgi:hypothetical protein
MFALRPSLTATAAGLDPNSPADAANGTMTITFDPPVNAGQAVRLMLDERALQAPHAAQLEPEAPAAFPAAALDFAYAGLRRAAYLVRAQVDGVESAPTIDADPNSSTFGQITGPEVDLT